MSVTTISYSYHTNLSYKGVSSDILDKLANYILKPGEYYDSERGHESENSLTEFSNYFSLGPTQNEFVYENTYSTIANDFHWQELPSPDNIIVRQSMMAAFYRKVKSPTPLIVTSRKIKDMILKVSKVEL